MIDDRDARVVVAHRHERGDMRLDVVDEVDGCNPHRALDARRRSLRGPSHRAVDVVGDDDLVAGCKTD